MSMKHAILALGLVIAVPASSFAQGTIRGAEHGADEGAAVAGPVGGVVGGAVGAATGTVGGVLGVGADHGCESKTVRRENGAGDSETVHRSNCP
jgi:hypothetical protein